MIREADWAQSIFEVSFISIISVAIRWVNDTSKAKGGEHMKSAVGSVSLGPTACGTTHDANISFDIDTVANPMRGLEPE